MWDYCKVTEVPTPPQPNCLRARVAWMERSGIWDNTIGGELPTRPCSRELFVHRCVTRSAVVAVEGACRGAAGSDSCGETAIAVSDRLW